MVVVEILWNLPKKDEHVLMWEMWLFLLMFLLAEHLDLNQITVGSKADVHIMTGRTSISSELLLTWAYIAKGLQSAAGFAQLQSKMLRREIGLTVMPLPCVLVYTEMDARLFALGDLAYNG